MKDKKNCSNVKATSNSSSMGGNNMLQLGPQFVPVATGKTSGKKIRSKNKTIPSDLCLRLQALSVKVRSSCELLSPEPKGSRRVRLFRASATTPKFHVWVNTPCGVSTFCMNQKTSTKTSRDRTWLLPTKLAHSSTEILDVNQKMHLG